MAEALKPETTATAAEVARAKPEPTPEEKKLADEAEKLNRVKTRTELEKLDVVVVGDQFIANKLEQNGIVTGEIVFDAQPRFEKIVGLKHILAPENQYVRVTAPDGTITEGVRGENGNYYTAQGNYIKIWNHYVFEASMLPLPALPHTEPAKVNTPQSAPELDSTSTVAPISAELVTPDQPETPAPAEQIASHETSDILSPLAISDVAFAGDSLTVALQNTGAIAGSIRPENYLRKGRKHGIAIGGQQTPAILEGLKHAEAKNELQNAKRLVVWGGINDIGSTRSPEAVAKELTEIYLLAAKNNMSIVACTVTPWRPTKKTMATYNKRWMQKLGKPYPYTPDQIVQHIEQVNEWIKTRAQQEVLAQYPNAQFQVVDLHTEIKNNPEKYPKIADNLHFTPEGTRAIGDFITAQANIKRPPEVV